MSVVSKWNLFPFIFSTVWNRSRGTKPNNCRSILLPKAIDCWQFVIYVHIKYMLKCKCYTLQDFSCKNVLSLHQKMTDLLYLFDITHVPNINREIYSLFFYFFYRILFLSVCSCEVQKRYILYYLFTLYSEKNFFNKTIAYRTDVVKSEMLLNLGVGQFSNYIVLWKTLIWSTETITRQSCLSRDDIFLLYVRLRLSVTVSIIHWPILPCSTNMIKRS